MRTRADVISEMIAGGKKIPVDQHGYRLDPEDWNEAAAEELARKAGVTLTPLHWDVLQFMRAILDEHGVAPDARFVFRFLEPSLREIEIRARYVFRAFSLWVYRAGVQDRRHASAPGLEHRLKAGAILR